ncbi:MAG: DUF4351 domain-containing protein [Magnetococcales bacterium]|nr:DUF4351 domain-containing protein [Magnetococcales bacterium]
MDLLVKVWLPGGAELWVLNHVEVQGDRDAKFAERMYTCQHRAYDLHRKPVVGLAILADEDPSWRVSEYRQVLWGSEVIYRFNTVKLLDYLDHLPDLAESDNPFAIVTLVHLTGKQTKSNPNERLQAKKCITRSLYRKGFSRQKVIDLYRFIDWVLSLPAELDDLFWEDLSNFEENQQMPYITSVERIGMEKGQLIGIQIGEQKGRQEGRQEEAASMLLKLMRRKFGQTPEWVTEKVLSAQLERIELWGENVLFANSVDEVFASGAT